MNCQTAREAISAILDEEPAGIDTVDLERHLAGCEACRQWRESAHEATRRARLRPAVPSALSSQDLVAAVRARVSARRWGARTRSLRIALVLCAAAQVALSVPLLMFPHSDAMRDLGALNLAVAVGFLVAAWNPTRASGMRPLVGSAAAFLGLAAIFQVTAGRTDVAHEAPELVVLAGWLLLRQLAKTTQPPADDAPWAALVRLGRGMAALFGRGRPAAEFASGHAAQSSARVDAVRTDASGAQTTAAHGGLVSGDQLPIKAAG